MPRLATRLIRSAVHCVMALAALVLLAVSAASAQPPDQLKTDLPTGDLLAADKPASYLPTSDLPTGPAREQYIPSDQLDVLFQRERRGVLMSREEFLKLLGQADRNAAAAAGQPPAIVAESARISVSQADQHALVALEIRIRQSAAGWHSLRVPAGNLLVEKIAIEGVSAPAVGRDPQDPQSLLVAHETVGTATLHLTLSTPLVRLGSDRTAAFRLPGVAAAQLTVDCPAGQQVLVNDLELERPAAAELPARYVLPVGAAEQVRLKWTEQRQRTEAQTLVFVRSDVQVQIQPEAARWTSDSGVSVFGGKISQLVARVPSRMEITAVDSTGLESWKLEDDPEHPGMTRVTLTWRQAFTNDRIIRIQGIAAQDGTGPHRIPTLEFADVAAHSGRLAVTRDDGLRLIAKTGAGVRAAADDPADEAPVARPSVALFDFWTSRFELQVAVKPRDRELYGEMNSVLSLEDTTATFTCALTIEPLNAPLFDLPLQLPADWQLVSVTSSGTPLAWRPGSTTEQILVLPANPVLPGGLFEVSLELRRTISDPETEQRLALPVVVPAATTIVGGGYTVRFADDLQVAPISLNGLGSVGGNGSELTFRNLGTEFSGELAISRRNPRLASRTVVRTWVDARQRTVQAEITIDVVHGTTRFLTVRLPENLGTDVRFQVASVGVVPGFEGQYIVGARDIVEQTPGDPVAGMRPFLLKLDRRFSGSVTLSVTVQLPRQPGDLIDAPRVQVADAVRQHGVIVFEAWPEQRLQATTDVSQIPGLFVADAALTEGSAVESGRRVALVYRFVQPDYLLAVAETRFPVEAVPSAVVEQVHNVCILHESGGMQRYCSAVFLSSGLQTLRFALPRPDSSFLWSTVLNGEPVEVRRDNGEYLVAIPSQSDGVKQTLEVLFEDRDELIGVLGHVQQDPVRFSLDIRDQASAPVDVLQQTWDVRYPVTSRLVDSDGEFRAVSGADQPGWFRRLLEPHLTAPFPLPRDIRMAAIFLLFLSVTTTIVRQRRWKTLTAAAASLFAALLAMLALDVLWRAEKSAAPYFFDTAAKLAAPPASTVYEEGLTGDSSANWRFTRPENRSRTGFGGGMGGGMGGMGGFGGGGAGGGMGGIGGGGMGGGAGGFMGGMGGGILGDGGAMDGSEHGIDPMGANAGSGSFGMPPGSPATAAPVVSEAAPGEPRIGVDFDFNVQPSNSGDEDSPIDGQQLPPVRQELSLVIRQDAATELSTGVDDANGDVSGRPGSGAAGAAAAGRDLLRRGSARLSVRIGLEVPEDFRSRRFQSLGDAVQTPGSLQLIVQSQDRISAARLVVALMIVIFCWWIRKAALLLRLGVLSVLVTAAIAALPLVPNQWQSALDGVILGSLAGGGIWCFVRILRLIRQAYAFCCTFCNFAAETGVSTVSVLLCLTGVMTSAVSGQTTAPAAGASDQERPQIVVPYSSEEPALRASRVFVGHDEFLRIYNQANPGALAARTVSPIGTAVVAAFYKADRLTPVDGTSHVLTVTARYLVISDADDAAPVELPLGPVAIRSVTLDGQPAVLQPVVMSAVKPPGDGTSSNDVRQVPVQQRQGPSNQATSDSTSESNPVVTGRPAYSVLIGSRGTHIVDLEFDVAAQVEAVSGRVDLPFRPVASGTLEFTLPSASQPSDDSSAAVDLRVNGRSNVYRRDGQTIILPIAASGETRIQWQPAARRSSDDTVTHTTVTSALSLLDHGLQLRSTIALNCRQGDLTELDVVIPADYVVQSVEGDDVAGWSLENSESTPILKLLFRRAIADSTSITLQLYSGVMSSGAVSSVLVPMLAVRGATRDSGTVLLRSGSQFQVRSESLSGVTQMNPDDAADPTGGELSGRRMLAWRYARHPAAVTVRVTRQAEELKVAALHAVRLEEQRQLWTSQLTLTIAGTPRSRIELLVPKSFLPLDVRAHGLRDWYLDDVENRAADGSPTETRILSLQLESARLGTVDVSIQGQADRDPADSRLTLNVPRIPDATEASSQLAVWLDAASENAGIEAGDWSARPPMGMDLRYRALMTEPASVAFVSSVPRPGPVIVLLRQAVATVIPESVTVTNVTDTSVDLLLALNWQITRAASDTFVVDLPSQLAMALSFNVPGQRRLIREDRGNGRTRLTIQLQNAVTDRLFVIGSGSLPLPANGEIRTEAPNFVSAVDTAETLSGQSHFWVLVNQSGGLLQPTDDEQKHKAETSQITIQIPPELLQQAVTIQRLMPDTAGWTLRFPRQHQTAPAVVTLASHITVLADDGSWRSRHQLQVRNESRQFLPVRIPAGSRLLYCLVRGTPTRVVMQELGSDAAAPARDLTAGQQLLIPIPQSGAIASAFDVEFTLAGNFGVAGAVLRENWTSSRVKVPVPVFPEFRDDPEFGVTISRNRWSVYVPESWKVRPVSDPVATNVIPAAEQDLQDAYLLSQVEVTSGLLNSLNSAKGRFARQRLYSALQEQQGSLGSFTGNTAGAEMERSQILSRLNELTTGREFEAVQGNTVGVMVPQEEVRNFFLYEQDLNQNSFNNDNELGFISGNGIVVRPSEPQTPADGRVVPGSAIPGEFRFDLPPEKSEQSPARRKSRSQLNESPGGRKGKQAELSEEAAAADKSGARSQLIQRRDSSMKPGERSSAEQRQQPADAPQEIQSEGDSDAGIQLQRGPEAVRDERSAPFGGADPFDTAIEGQSAGLPRGSGGVRAAASAGVLSLQFDIPADGQRHDFLRTGGNSALSFDVRAARAVDLGFGAAWMVLCSAAAVPLIVACRRGEWRAFLNRLLFLVAVAGLVGRVINTPLGGWCLGVCLVASVCLSFSLMRDRK